MDLMRESVLFEESLLSMDRLTARDILLSASNSRGPLPSVENIVVPAMERIGAGWETGKFALSQVYMSGRICEEVVDLILPPHAQHRTQHPQMAIVLLDDYHTLGKRIVHTVLRSSGYEPLDYGQTGDIQHLVKRTQNDKIEILLISVLMLRSALLVKDITDNLKHSGSNAKIIVGGAPFRFDKELWQIVGADAMAATASEVIGIIKKFEEAAS
jgi:monomethylamine corrinoid protein